MNSLNQSDWPLTYFICPMYFPPVSREGAGDEVPRAAGEGPIHLKPKEESEINEGTEVRRGVIKLE